MAARSYNAAIDLGGSELRNAVIQNLAVFPETAKPGQVVYYTGDSTLRMWTGESWVVLATIADVPVASDASPPMDGTASAGSSGSFARGDHVHPADTSKADLSALTAHTGDGTIHTSSAEKAAWNSMQPLAQRNLANGYAGLDGSGKIVVGMLPTGAGGQQIPLIAQQIPDGYLVMYSASAGGFVGYEAGTVYRPCGSVATYDDLPSDPQEGDVYNVLAAYQDYPPGTNFAWTAQGAWDSLGGTVDLSAYATTVWVETQLSTKQDAIVGAATSITDSDLAVSRILVSDASGKVAASDISADVLGYLSGLTGNIQQQLSAKASRFEGSVSGDGTTTSWTIAHGLGAKPVVGVYDASGKLVLTDVTATDTQITISVDRPLSSGEVLSVLAVA